MVAAAASSGGSVVVDSLLIVVDIGVLCFVMRCLYCPYYFCNHLAGEERAGCFKLIYCLLHVVVSALCLFLVLPWIGRTYKCKHTQPYHIP